MLSTCGMMELVYALSLVIMIAAISIIQVRKYLVREWLGRTLALETSANLSLQIWSLSRDHNVITIL